MTYALPPSGTAQASWVGAETYALPGAGAIEATWVEVPTVPPNAEAAESLGAITVFGTPRRTTLAAAAGIAPTWFAGTAISTQQSPAVSLGIIANLGTPSRPSLQMGDAVGNAASYFGRPITAPSARSPAAHRSLSANGTVVTAFGAATAHSSVIAAAVGTPLLSFGLPNHALGQRASGTGPTALFGAGTARMSGRPAGNKFAALGTPSAVRTQTAASTYRATRWGVAGTERSDTYLAHGLYNPARFAQPAAVRLNAFAAAGTTSTQVGSPACYLRYRALHTAPACRFGKPLMLWGSPC